jgi:spermidine synthase
VAREVCKHPSVEKADLVEIDEMVVEVSKQYLPNMSVGFTNPKLTLHVEDGFKFMQKHSKEYDVIITDSSDPIGGSLQST